MYDGASNDASAIRAQMQRSVTGTKLVKEYALQQFNHVKEDLLGSSFLLELLQRLSSRTVASKPDKLSPALMRLFLLGCR